MCLLDWMMPSEMCKSAGNKHLHTLLKFASAVCWPQVLPFPRKNLIYLLLYRAKCSILSILLSCVACTADCTKNGSPLHVTYHALHHLKPFVAGQTLFSVSAVTKTTANSHLEVLTQGIFLHCSCLPQQHLQDMLQLNSKSTGLWKTCSPV